MSPAIPQRPPGTAPGAAPPVTGETNVSPGPPAAPPLARQLLVATLARLVLNTGHRMVYPFLPALSRGLGVDETTLRDWLALRGALGMAAPLAGGLPDRFGRRTTMLLGLVVFSLGLALVGLAPQPGTLLAFLILVVVAKFLFDPALQAYLGDNTPYGRRGLVIAITEIAWSGAALVGFPLVGLAMARGSWRAPFLPLAALGVIAGLALWVALPATPRAARRSGQAATGLWRAVVRHPAVLAGVGLGLLISLSNELLNVVYASWLDRSFGLSVAQLGASTTVIGAAELAGEALVMTLADRLGKRRAIALGLLASAAAYAALPALSGSLQLGLAALFLVFIAFEFTIVTTLPLMTELVPGARGHVMSANVAAHAAGRMLGALLGARLFPLGFGAIGLAAAAGNLLALGLLVVIREER